MTLTSLYPVLMTDDVAAAGDFFTRHFDFETTFANEWHVSLQRDGFELAVLQAGHATIPETYPRATTGGLLINLEVEDVDDAYDRLVGREGLTPLRDIRTEDFGQRHFILAGPEGTLIDVITPTPPTEEYAASFVQ